MAIAETIERRRDYIPHDVYVLLSDAAQEFYNKAPWSSDPETMTKVLPHILRAAILKDWDEAFV